MAARRTNARKKAKRRRHAGARKALLAQVADIAQNKDRRTGG